MEQGNNKSFLSDEVVKEEELSFLSDEVVTEGEVKKKASSEATSGVPTLLKPPIKESTLQSEQGGLDFSQTPSEILAKETPKKELDLSNIFYKAQKGQLQADLVDFAIPDQEPNKNTPNIDDLTLRTKVVRGLREQSKEKAQALKNGLGQSVVEGERLIEQYKNNPTPELKAEIEQRQQDFLLTQKAYNKEAFIQDAYEKRLVQSSDSIKRLANDKISDNFYAGVYQGLKGNVESWGESKELFLKSKAEQIEYAKKQNEIAPTKEGGLINQAGQMIGGVLPDIAAAIGFSLAGLPSVGATTVAVRQGAQQAAEDFSRAFNKAKITKMDFGGEMRLPTDDEAYDIATKSAGVGFGTGAIEGLFGTITGNVGGRIANRARTKVGKIVAEKALDTGIDATVAGTMQTGRNVFDRAQGLDTKLTEGVAENMLGEILLSAPINTVSGVKAVSKEKKNQRAKSIFESVVKSKDNPEELQKLKENIEVLTNQGLITKEDAVEITQKANDYARVVPTIPEEVKNKQEAADLIIERDELEVKKESVDKAFQKPIEERINAINEELVNVDNKENEIRSTDNNIPKQVESPRQEIKLAPIEVIAGKEQGDGGFAKVVQGDGQGELAPKTKEEIVAEVELKKQETERKIKRRDLFDGVGEFSTELGGSDKAAVPVSHKEKNGIEFVEYAHPETGSVDVIVTGKSDNDFVGFYRIYENGKPTNKWSSKFENQSRNKEDFKTMIGGVQEMLPQGHEYTEKSSISTDGLRVWEQQLSRGYELQYDKNGKLITNLVAINGDAIVNELGIPVQKGDFENIKVKSQEEFEIVKKALLPYLEKLGLGENDIRWLTGTVKINLPVLKSTKETPQEKAVGENVEVVIPKVTPQAGSVGVGGDFKIDDKDTFYHASNTKRSGRLKPSTAKQFGTGVYFTTNKDLAKSEFGEEVTEVKLALDNPVYTNTKEWSSVEKLALEKANEGKPKDEDGDIVGEEYDIAEIKAKFISDAAKELGYDAIIDKNSSQYENEIVVLDETKIKYPEDISEQSLKETPKEVKVNTPEKVQEEAKPLTKEEIQAEEEQDEMLLSGESDKRRRQGKFTKDGITYERQKETEGVEGSQDEVVFAKGVTKKFKYKVIDRSQLQPSHLGGLRNSMHFIPEAQPKRRTDSGSIAAEQTIANNPNLKIAGENTNAYSGAPVVNKRGEVIQGNNRAAGLVKAYKQGTASNYKQDLINNAEKYGMTKEQVEAMEEPVLVRELDVNDTESIELGNYEFNDIETGNVGTINPVKIVSRMTKKIKEALVREAFKGEYGTTNESIRGNFDAIEELLVRYLNVSQYQALRDSNKNPSTKGIEAVNTLLQRLVFDGGDVALSDMFEGLPPSKQNTILKAAVSIISLPTDITLLQEFQNAIVGFSNFVSRGAKSVDAWSKEYDAFTNSSPRDIYTPLELEMIRLLSEKPQSEFSKMFKDYSVLVKGKKAEGMWGEDVAPITKAEAVETIFKIKQDEQQSKESGTGSPKKVSGEKAEQKQPQTPTEKAIDVYKRLSENNDTSTRKEYKALPESIKRVLDNIVNIHQQLEQKNIITKKGNCP